MKLKEDIPLHSIHSTIAYYFTMPCAFQLFIKKKSFCLSYTKILRISWFIFKIEYCINLAVNVLKIIYIKNIYSMSILHPISFPGLSTSLLFSFGRRKYSFMAFTAVPHIIFCCDNGT